MPPKGRKRKRGTGGPSGSSQKAVRRPANESAGSSSRQQSAGLSQLSTDPESRGDPGDLVREAYHRIDQYTVCGKADDEKLKPSLRAFLDWLPEGGRESVAKDVVDAVSDDELWAVFHNLLTGIALPMKALSRQSTVTSSPHAKRQEHVEIVAGKMDEPEARDPDFRKECFRRDDHRCVITGEIDTDHWEQLGCPKQNHAPLVGAHIIPFAYGSWDKTQGAGKDRTESWTVLWRCFPGIRKVGMNWKRINDPSNGLSLKDSMHTRFGQFLIAFQPTESKHVYKLKTYRKFPPSEKMSLPARNTVKLKQAEGSKDVPLPDPVLLDCHFRMAEILNASGMGEIIERHLREWDDIKGAGGSGALREDGNTDLDRFLRAGLWEYVQG